MTALTEQSRRLRDAYQRSQGLTVTIDGTQTRVHIERLTARGWTQRQIAHAAGLNATTLNAIVTGKSRKVRRENAAAVLSIRLDSKPTLPRGYVDATGTRRRLQALMVLGYPVSLVALKAGLGRSTLHPAVDGTWATVHSSTAARVARVYRNLCLHPSPRGPRAEQARNEAAANGWHGPMAWEDIDNPACQPDPGGPVAPRHVHPDDIAELAARGLDDAVIGQRLKVAPRTVLRARTAYGIPAGVAS
ncbi:helix-turn-helix transcriptional regulator [Streptomyces sp. C1-2]|uniref:helix-turn-helix domain-containing protein n=1 Tax=Streptomyces sp. C1-2 TaxID=2720022 RepID=UPI0014325184|nr:helix-turn-helix transcriptional regulator [Streptomyces sp. C1-2]NJP70405.1 helix-turn-helix transcriptional regulator [Streptomyces sp. C1-2]